MKNSLYDIFAEKYGPDICIISDTHFGDLDCYKMRFPDEFEKVKRVIQSVSLLCDVVHDQEEEEAFTKAHIDFNNIKLNEFVERMDKMQIDKINKIAGKTSTLIILGDVGDIECVKKLKAKYKVLVLGNHDRGASYYKRVIEHEVATMQMSGFDGRPIILKKEGPIISDNHLFDEVYEGTLQIGPKLILSHEPIDYKYALNIHGHTHSIKEAFYKEEITSGPTETGEDEKFAYYHYCVIGEVNNYEPVRLNKLIKDGYLKDIPDIHRQTIDKATERKHLEE